MLCILFFRTLYEKTAELITAKLKHEIYA